MPLSLCLHGLKADQFLPYLNDLSKGYVAILEKRQMQPVIKLWKKDTTELMQFNNRQSQEAYSTTFDKLFSIYMYGNKIYSKRLFMGKI